MFTVLDRLVPPCSYKRQYITEIKRICNTKFDTKVPKVTRRHDVTSDASCTRFARSSGAVEHRGPPTIYVPSLLATAKAMVAILGRIANCPLNCQLIVSSLSATPGYTKRSGPWYYQLDSLINFISIHFVCFKNDLFSHVSIKT